MFSTDTTAMDKEKAYTPSSSFWDTGMVAFLFCAVVALGLPIYVAATYSIYWACLAAVLITIFWVLVMPCTCRSGGFISAMIGCLIILNGCGYVLAAGFKFIGSFF
jgi:predicted ABC-type exoprotein transport system permease subunit